MFWNIAEFIDKRKASCLDGSKSVVFHKFMQFRLPGEIGAQAGKGNLILEHGTFAGRNYEFKLLVCPNPCCQCKHIEMHCVLIQPADSSLTTKPLKLTLDFIKHQIALAAQEEQKSARQLSEAILQEIAHIHWQMLADRFVEEKRRISEADDIEKFEPIFEDENSINSGLMVAYYEILPYAGSIEIKLDGQTWTLDDQYCLRDECNCCEAGLMFILVDKRPKKRKRKPFTVSVRYNYATGIFSREPGSKESPIAEPLCLAFRDQYPDLNAMLAKRQQKLMRLLDKARGRKTAPNEPPQILGMDSARDTVPRPEISPLKPGRNEPCPCGSGKKYKKCCGK